MFSNADVINNQYWDVDVFFNLFTRNIQPWWKFSFCFCVRPDEWKATVHSLGFHPHTKVDVVRSDYLSLLNHLAITDGSQLIGSKIQMKNMNTFKKYICSHSFAVLDRHIKGHVMVTLMCLIKFLIKCLIKWNFSKTESYNMEGC